MCFILDILGPVSFLIKCSVLLFLYIWNRLHLSFVRNATDCTEGVRKRLWQKCPRNWAWNRKVQFYMSVGMYLGIISDVYVRFERFAVLFSKCTICWVANVWDEYGLAGLEGYVGQWQNRAELSVALNCNMLCLDQNSANKCLGVYSWCWVFFLNGTS